MCGLFGGGSPAPTIDYQAKQAEADAKAAQSANEKLAARNRRRAASSLLATGQDGQMQGQTPAKTVLGA